MHTNKPEVLLLQDVNIPSHYGKIINCCFFPFFQALERWNANMSSSGEGLKIKQTNYLVVNNSGSKLIGYQNLLSREQGQSWDKEKGGKLRIPRT